MFKLGGPLPVTFAVIYPPTPTPPPKTAAKFLMELPNFFILLIFSNMSPASCPTLSILVSLKSIVPLNSVLCSVFLDLSYTNDLDNLFNPLCSSTLELNLYTEL